MQATALTTTAMCSPVPVLVRVAELFLLDARAALGSVLDNWQQSQREIAHKALVFIVEDLHRGADGKGPRGVPVATVYLGPSCTNDAIEQLRDRVIAHLHKNQIEVKMAVSDKQFLNFIEQSTSAGSLPKSATQASRNAKRLLDRVPQAALEDLVAAHDAADAARVAMAEAADLDGPEQAALAQQAADAADHAAALAADAVGTLLARDAKRLSAAQADEGVDDDDGASDGDDPADDVRDGAADDDADREERLVDARAEADAAAAAARSRDDRAQRRAAVEGKAAKRDDGDDSGGADPAPQEAKRAPPVGKPPAPKRKPKPKSKGKVSPSEAAAARARIAAKRDKVGRLIYEAYLDELKNKHNLDFRSRFYFPLTLSATLIRLLETTCANHNVKTVRQAICNGWKEDVDPAQRRLYLSYLRIAVDKDAAVAAMVPKGVLQGKWPQDVDIARQLFTVAVSKKLRANGDKEAADLADVLRGYYEAVDVSGLSAASRRANMRAVLSFFGFDGPAAHASLWPPRRYIKGIAIQTVAGLCISAEAYLLLGDATGDLFHPRVFTTDMIESFFSR